MKDSTKRSILRWIHIVFAIPIAVMFIVRLLNFLRPHCPVCRRSCNCPFGIMDVERPCPSTTHFETIGLTRQLQLKRNPYEKCWNKKGTVTQRT